MKKFTLWPFLAIILVILGYFSPFFFQNKLPIPSDAIVGLYHPYRDFYSIQFSRGYPFKNFLITDPLRQQYPWREIVINSLEKLELPIWNPYNGAGEPLMANIQSAALYPLNILLFSLPFSLGWSLLILLQPLLAATFLYLYLVNLKVSKEGSLIGAVAFAFSGFNTAWLEWGTIAHTGLWLPLILLSIDKLIFHFSNFKFSNFTHPASSVRESQISNKNMLAWSFVFLVSLCSSLFAGHLQTFFYLFIFSIVYIVVKLSGHKKTRIILLSFLFLYSCFFIITAIQWLPTLQLINESARSIDQIWQKDGWFVPYPHLIQFIAPDFFGNPSTQNYWGTWNYGEMVGYIGMLPFILATCAILFRRDKKTLFFGTVTVAGLLFALPTFLAKIPFILGVPFLSTAQPTRLIFIVCFSLSVLAALGFDILSKSKKNGLVSSVVICLVVASLWMIVVLRPAQLVIPPEYVVVAKNNLILPSLLLVTSILLLLSMVILAKKRKLKLVIYVGMFALVAFDLLRFSGKFNTFTDKNILFPETKTIKYLSDKTRDYPWRFLGVDYVQDQKRIFVPNISAHNRLYTLDTYNPLLLRRYQEFAAVSEWGFVDIPDVSFNRAIILNNYESRLVDFLGVKYVVTINDVFSDKLKFVTREGETRIYENRAAFPRAFMVYDVLTLKDKRDIAKKMYDNKTDLRKTAIIEEPLPTLATENSRNNVQIKKYEANKIALEVTTEKDGLLVLTDTYYPSWHAKIDEKEVKIYRADYAFRGVFVPKGKHHVYFYASLL